MSFSQKLFSQKLLELRKERDMTQAEVGKALGVHPRHVSSWENGRTKPSLETVINLAQLFAVSIDYLIFENVPREGFETINDFDLYQKFRQTEKLGPQDKKLISDLIDSVLFKVKVEDMVARKEDLPEQKLETTPLRKVAGRR